jgi:hypothetical protein
MRLASLLQLGSITLNPAIDSGVINVQASFQQNFFEIAIT